MFVSMHRRLASDTASWSLYTAWGCQSVQAWYSQETSSLRLRRPTLATMSVTASQRQRSVQLHSRHAADQPILAYWALNDFNYACNRRLAGHDNLVEPATFFNSIQFNWFIHSEDNKIKCKINIIHWLWTGCHGWPRPTTNLETETGCRCFPVAAPVVLELTTVYHGTTSWVNSRPQQSKTGSKFIYLKQLTNRQLKNDDVNQIRKLL